MAKKTLTDYEVWNELGVLLDAADYILEQDGDKKLVKSLRKCYDKLAAPHEGRTKKAQGNIKLYYHKTDGGAEYLMDTYVSWKHNGKSGREGTFNDKTRYIVRIDGDITKDVKLIIC